MLKSIEETNQKTIEYLRSQKSKESIPEMLVDEDWNSRDIDQEDIIVEEVNLNNDFGGKVKNEANKIMKMMKPPIKKKIRIKTSSNSSFREH